MKKALTLLFTFMVAGALALPVFADDAPAAGQENSNTKMKKHKKSKKAKNAGDAPATQ